MSFTGPASLYPSMKTVQERGPRGVYLDSIYSKDLKNVMTFLINMAVISMQQV